MSKIEVDAIDKQSGSTLTLGGSGTAVTLATGATQSGFGRTGTVDWDTTPKTSTFTAVSGDGFFCNTTGGAFTCNLPAGTAGAIVSVADYAGTWQTNALTVSPNGTDKIGSVNSDIVLNTEGQSVTLIFVDSTQGWINIQDSTSNERGSAFVVATGGTITTSGNDKIHTFTGPGTFTVSQAASCAANNVVSHLVVAGGGAGGTTDNSKSSGAGGGGGYREVKSPVTPYTASPLDGYPSAPNRVTVSAQAYPITVGAGGTATPSPTSSAGGQGGTSTFSTVSSAGGGGGGGKATANAGTGGSGGGAAGGSYSPRCGAAGNTPPVSPAQGFPGGCSHPGPPDQNGAGGGGATQAGQQTRPASNPSGTGGGAGGAGATTEITTSPLSFSGGGGGSGGSNANANPVGRGANGGGNSAAVNTGGGGGANTSGAGGGGGSGIVVIRYKFQ